jgi:hypothetical protein
MSAWGQVSRPAKKSSRSLARAAITGVRSRRLNPDRVRMRIGRVLAVIGFLLVVVGFASFIFAGFRATSQTSSGFPVPVLAAFAVFVCGGFLAVMGGWLVRAGPGQRTMTSGMRARYGFPARQAAFRRCMPGGSRRVTR